MNDKSKVIVDALCDHNLFPALTTFTYDSAAIIIRGYVKACDSSVTSMFLNEYNNSHSTSYTDIDQIPNDKLKSVIYNIIRNIEYPNLGSDYSKFPRTLVKEPIPNINKDGIVVGSKPTEFTFAD